MRCLNAGNVTEAESVGFKIIQIEEKPLFHILTSSKQAAKT